MSTARGQAAYRQQAAAANARFSGGFANILLLKDGEQVLGRFRGLLRPPPFMWPKESLMQFEEAAAIQLAAEYGIYNEWEDQNEFAEAVLQRYNEVEPFVYVQHYTHGAPGPSAYNTCGQAKEGELVIWDPPIDCVGCYLKDAGDKRISRRTQAAFSFQPLRKVHISAGAKPGAKKDFSFCSMEEEGHCRGCAAGIEAKQESMKYLSLANQHAAALIVCATRIAKKCALCLIGVVRPAGWRCAHPDCGEFVPAQLWAQFNQLRETGDIIDYNCRSCNYKGQPEEMVNCVKGCQNARRAQLHDMNVLVQRVGADKSTTYQFTEQYSEPLDPELLKMKLPAYEQRLRPKSVQLQCQAFGITYNPFNPDQAIEPDADAAETYDDEEYVEPFSS